MGIWGALRVGDKAFISQNLYKCNSLGQLSPPSLGDRCGSPLEGPSQEAPILGADIHTSEVFMLNRHVERTVEEYKERPLAWGSKGLKEAFFIWFPNSQSGILFAGFRRAQKELKIGASIPYTLFQIKFW